MLRIASANSGATDTWRMRGSAAAAAGSGTVSVVTISHSGEAHSRAAASSVNNPWVTTARTERARVGHHLCHVGQAAAGEHDVVDQDRVAIAHLAQERGHFRAFVVKHAHLVAHGDARAEAGESPSVVADERAGARVG